jgi:hypothetical protein
MAKQRLDKRRVRRCWVCERVGIRLSPVFNNVMGHCGFVCRSKRCLSVTGLI